MSARVTRIFDDPAWPSESFVIRAAAEASFKRRKRNNGVPFHRAGPGWAEYDQPESWTPLGIIPAHVERIDWETDEAVTR